MPNVADIAVDAEDGLGQKITILYGRNGREFCVYGVEKRVMICFADDKAVNEKQRKDLSVLAPLRGEIDGLIDGWRDGTERSLFGFAQSSRLLAKAAGYNRRVADALVLALEGDVGTAGTLLSTIKQNIIDERVARARFEYLIAAFLTALGLMFVGWLVTATYGLVADRHWAPRRAAAGWVVLLLAGLAASAFFYLRWVWSGKDAQANTAAAGSKTYMERFWASLWPAVFVFAAIAIPIVALMMKPVFEAAVSSGRRVDFADGIDVWRAAAAGSVGAFFSIAIGIRGRTVLPDLQRTSNLMDAALRVTIGFIGASVLMALVKLQLINVTIGTSQALGGETLLSVLIIGFIAGFSERMVPDLLGKASVQTAPPRPAPPADGKADGGKKDDGGGGAGAGAGGSGGNGGGGAKGPAAADDPPPDAYEDGCVCDHELEDENVTHDTDLPPASGGVAAKAEEKPQ